MPPTPKTRLGGNNRISHVVTIPYFPWQKELSWSHLLLAQKKSGVFLAAELCSLGLVDMKARHWWKKDLKNV